MLFGCGRPVKNKDARIAKIEKAPFSKTVSALNIAHSSEIKVKISTKDKTLDVAGVPVKLTAKALAIYLFFVKKAMRTETLGRTFEYFPRNPSKSEKDNTTFG